MIGHYEFGLRPTERALHDADMRAEYKKKLDEWTALEREIKRQTRQQKEKQAQDGDKADGDVFNLSNYASPSGGHSPVMERIDSLGASSREASLSPVHRTEMNSDFPDATSVEEVDEFLEKLDGDSGCEDLEADSSGLLQQYPVSNEVDTLFCLLEVLVL